ncbi:GMC family oxidoreductase [Alphaproteobacteria bacterium]|nr:GMC family oxidoreductase [Alphaproteobacteria bacterium]
MHSELSELNQETDLACDICVVGSGPASLSFVSKFFDSNLKILIVESGKLDYSESSQQLNEAESAGPRYLDLKNSRFRGYGGAGKIWAGVCRPMSADDFLPKNHIPLSGWPVSFSDLEFYYKEAAEIFGLDYNRFFDEDWSEYEPYHSAFSRLNHSQTKIDRLKFQQATEESRDLGKRWLKRIFEHGFIQLITDATVVDVRRNIPSGYSVIAKSLAQEVRKINAKVLILGAGAIENPRILMTSEAHKSIRRNDFLGSCFMSHPGFGPLADVKLSNNNFCVSQGSEQFFNFEANLVHRNESKILRHGIALTRARSIGHNLSSNASLSGVRQELSNYFAGLKCELFGYGKYVASDWLLSVGLEQPPIVDNRVSLSSKKDLHSVNVPKVYWGAISEQEKKTVRSAIRLFAQELGIVGLGNLALKDELLASTIFGDDDPINHHIGTTRMSRSEDRGVVDSNLEHFQLRNLFLTGSSVFSTSSIVNPTMTIVALSLRLGEYVKARFLG